MIRDQTAYLFSEATDTLHSKDVAIIIFVVKFEYNWCLWKLFLCFAFINNDCRLKSAEKYILIQINISFQYILLYSLLQIHLSKYHNITTRTYLIKLVLNLVLIINIYQNLYLDVYQKLYFDKDVSVCHSVKFYTSVPYKYVK